MTRAGNRHVFRCLARTPLDEASVVALSDADARHLLQVVRLRSDERIELIDPTGTRWPARIDARGGPVLARVTGPGQPAAPPLPLDLWLGLADWDRLEVVARMASELGLARLRLFTSSRSGRVRDVERRTVRLERIAEEAVRQSGRGWPPAIEPLVPFATMIGAVRDSPSPVVVLDPRSDASLRTVLATSQSATLVVGGEHGLSDDEVDALTALGARTASLGPGTLRTETAAVAALVAAATAMDAL